MAYQFIYIETYSEDSTKVKGADGHFNTAAQVLGEAMRIPEYSAHVEFPSKAYRLGSTIRFKRNVREFWRTSRKP